MTTKLPFVQAVKGHHYLRYKNTQRVKIEGTPGTSEFKANYDRLLRAAKAAAARADALHEMREPIKKKQCAGDGMTIDAAVRDFLANSDAFARVAPGTQVNYRRIFRALCAYATEGGRLGNAPVVGLTRDHVKKMITKVVPARSGKNFIGCFRALMKHCVEELRIIEEDKDPTLGVKLPARTKREKVAQKEGLKSWPSRYIEMFRAHWPEGTQQRTALELMRWSGGACVDAMKFGWANFETDATGTINLIYVRQKTSIQATNPYWPELQAYLEGLYPANWRGPFLRRQPRNQPWDASANDAFSRWFQAACRSAGIPAGYNAHGVRKFYITERAEHGASVTDLMAFGGWEEPEQAIHYARAADKKKAAQRALEAAETVSGTRQTA
jgi:integrase